MFPEALLQRVDDDWLTEIPSAAEAFLYFANERYIRSLMDQLGDSSGNALEFLADYLMSQILYIEPLQLSVSTSLGRNLGDFQRADLPKEDFAFPWLHFSG
jgi:hypothetical protein